MFSTKSTRSDLLFNSGGILLRYSLIVVLIWIGILKFAAYEANGVRPLAEHSPFLSWTYGLLSTTNLSGILGAIEISTGLLIASRPFSAKLSAIGSSMAALMFIVTLSFLFSTPGIIQEGMMFPFLSGSPGQFLIKDLVLLGASVWTAGESIAALNKSKTNNTAGYELER